MSDPWDDEGFDGEDGWDEDEQGREPDLEGDLDDPEELLVEDDEGSDEEEDG